ncbi:hypothetical protein [Kordia antarctica]|uniref:hypothetical protein n=1 Tax=Kordia antarctica TaxID=1218801 RepID=UPI0013575F4D|nr:hypothetical protein [Kordia antarctica]
MTYFETHHSEIICLQIPNRSIDDLFIDHLMQGRKPKSLPKLVKIDGNNLLVKEHYNSFKHCIRRTNNTNRFFELIESSIQNLEKPPYKEV